MKIFIILCMLFMHVLADYNLQGWLASAKQKDWWKENAPAKLYKYDYIAALFMHSFQWTFAITIPCIIYNYFNIGKPTDMTVYIYCINIILFTILHMIIDNMKANTKSINLIIDQLLHIGQIIWLFHLLCN